MYNFFSDFTFWGGFVTNPLEFGILRFLAGLGIGGVMPNLVALTSEYAPKRIVLWSGVCLVVMLLVELFQHYLAVI